jgi:para-aminobenzoate synthetase/4-amino-4-deoxychorismate lyase
MDILTQFEKKPLCFYNPKKVITCHTGAKVRECFDKIEEAVKKGYYAAGFFSYEAGYCFEENLASDKSYDFPLIHFGIYEPPKHKPSFKKSKASYELKNLQLNVSPSAYRTNIQAILDQIALGNVYQITYCIKLLMNFSGDPQSLFWDLLRSHPMPFPSFIKTDAFNILSLSPELFIKKIGTHVTTKPMKGTWPRGRNILFDLMEFFYFRNDKKNRAENLMITDLLRNDLGRIGKNICAPKLFEIAKYRTLYQMTSTVTSHVDRDIPLFDLFASIFPSGSVTGAPKISAMEIIRGLENEERKIYTGAIGYITPEKDLFFNVPIRTLLIQKDSAEMGIGGGIVWDSTPKGEWEEGMLKAQFIANIANEKSPFKSPIF